MSEFIGYAYYAEIPAVIFNIQRVGPSTGMPTRTQQADILSCAYASHGDTKHTLLFPGSPEECFLYGREAFDLADYLQTPVFVMSELELGMNEYMCSPLKMDPDYKPIKGKVLTAEELAQKESPFYRYDDVDGDAIPYRTLPFTSPNHGANLTRGSGHDKFGRYTEDGTLYQENMDRVLRKFKTAKEKVPGPKILRKEGSKFAAVFVGIIEEPTQGKPR